jgi:prepilin-type N-terminal cleavage/methylation domain-containing protein
MDRNRGFTLPEMLTVIMIIGILAAFAFPAMSKFLATQGVRSASYDLFADLIYARSEAISRGTTVTIQATTSTDFKQGYTVRENGGGTVLRQQPARDTRIQFTGSANAVTFDRSGRANAQIFFNIIPASNITNPQDYMKRCIRLDPSGRPKSSEGSC